MMMHIGDAIQSTGKTVLQDKAAALLYTLLLASDATGPSDGAPTVAEAPEELAAFERHHTGFRSVEEHEELFQEAYENLERRVAAEFESYIHGALHCHCAHSFRFLVGCRNEPLTQNVQISQKALVLKELLHRWKSLGDSTEDRVVADCNISNNTFTILTQVRQQQEGLLALLASSSHAKTMLCSTSTGTSAGSRSDDGPGGGHFQVTVHLGRSRTQSR